MSLRFSYSVLAPFYDRIVGRGSQSLRQQSLEELKRIDLANANILIDGIGSGLVIPHLPDGPAYTGIDLTPNMLNLAKQRVEDRSITLQTGDAMALPFEDAQFEVVIMHLILAVVPSPPKALSEASRVLKPNGIILIMDKFLTPGQFAPLRQLINPLISRVATNTNIVFEEVLSHCQQLTIIKDEPSLMNGWFRQIVLQKTTS